MQSMLGDFISTFLSTDDILNVPKCPHLLTETLQSFICDFLNTFVPTTPISLFPGEISSGEGISIQEMIENISNGKKPQGINTMFKTKSTNLLQQKYERMKSLITFLKSNGAIIPPILVDFFLEREYFLAFMQRRITEWILGINYYGALSLESFNSAIMKSFSATSNFSEAFVSRLRTADSLYQQLHDEAWLQVVLQVFKKILFPTIRAEDFLQLLVLMKQLLI